jgi:hypothetical protein
MESPPVQCCSLAGASTGAAIIFGATGGVLEAALRSTAAAAALELRAQNVSRFLFLVAAGYFVATGKVLPSLNLTMVCLLRMLCACTFGAHLCVYVCV